MLVLSYPHWVPVLLSLLSVGPFLLPTSPVFPPAIRIKWSVSLNIVPMHHICEIIWCLSLLVAVNVIPSRCTHVVGRYRNNIHWYINFVHYQCFFSKEMWTLPEISQLHHAVKSISDHCVLRNPGLLKCSQYPFPPFSYMTHMGS